MIPISTEQVVGNIATLELFLRFRFRILNCFHQPDFVLKCFCQCYSIYFDLETNPAPFVLVDFVSLYIIYFFTKSYCFLFMVCFQRLFDLQLRCLSVNGIFFCHLFYFLILSILFFSFFLFLRNKCHIQSCIELLNFVIFI